MIYSANKMVRLYNNKVGNTFDNKMFEWEMQWNFINGNTSL